MRYFAQSALEKAKSLPVTPFMDKEKVIVHQTQVNFIDTILLPTFTLLLKTLPEFQTHIDSILVNKQSWANQAPPPPPPATVESTTP